MPDLKSALINIQQQIRSSIETQQIIERQVQNLIDGIGSSPDQSAKSIESQMKSLIDVLGDNLYHNLKSEFSQEIGFVRNEINELKKYREYHQTLSLLTTSSPPHQQAITANKSVEQNKQKTSNHWQKLSDDYNQFGFSFSGSYPVTEVDETKDFIEIRRANSNINVVLAPSTSGKFWLVEINGYICLMPNPKQSFNKHNSEVLESLFFFQEPYYAGYKRIFLISPAMLCANRSGEVTVWQLQEKGNISFTL